MIDSRLKGYNGQITHATQPLERTFCVVCGKPCGGASMETSKTIKPDQVIVVCDDCHAACGGHILGLEFIGYKPE